MVSFSLFVCLMLWNMKNWARWGSGRKNEELEYVIWFLILRMAAKNNGQPLKKNRCKRRSNISVCQQGPFTNVDLKESFHCKNMDEASSVKGGLNCIYLSCPQGDKYFRCNQTRGLPSLQRGLFGLPFMDFWPFCPLLLRDERLSVWCYTKVTEGIR